MANSSLVGGITSRAFPTLILLGFLLLTGCVGLPPFYPVTGEGTYKVRSGDTLYSIAFRHGLDYRSLARINGITLPYTIYPDQVLRLQGSAKLPEKDQGPAVSRASTSAPVPSKKHNLPSSVARWHWPLNGEIVGRFSLENPINKGIDIAGKEGDPVLAAADGVVVYAGGNLRGYGKLVIIKHSDNFLSTYGNNAALLVSEGDKVRAGRSIARVGSSAANQEMLHFEIRRDGKPVDPLGLLPSP